MKNPFQKLFILVMLWLCTSDVIFAQTPAVDLDSITEDSYMRMLVRQAMERETDTTLTNLSEPVLAKVGSKNSKIFYYLIGSCVLVGVVLIYWYMNKSSKISHIQKK